MIHLRGFEGTGIGVASVASGRRRRRYVTSLLAFHCDGQIIVASSTLPFYNALGRRVTEIYGGPACG